MRPGLSVFFGSSPRLMARIISSATGDLCLSSLSTFKEPTPCSAENEPPNFSTASYTSVLMRYSSFFRNALVSMFSGACTL